MVAIRERPPRDPATLSAAETIALSGRWRTAVEARTDDELRALHYDWEFWRRPTQVAPRGRWRTWFNRAGRGAGKTRTGAETVRRRVKRGHARYVAFIGRSAGDVRDIQIEGESGILRCSPRDERPDYQPSKRRLVWPNGSQGATFSADEPDQLRGPQHDLAWGDEPASWRFGKEAFDNAVLGLRLGRDPRMILSGTPKPVPWLREEAERPSMVTTISSTYENLTNLAESFIQDILDRYEGTRLGDQEIHARWLDDVEGALWQLAIIELNRLHIVPAMPGMRVVIGVDPPGETAECGIVAGIGPAIPHRKGEAYVIADESLAGPPEKWGAQVVSLYCRTGAERVVVESNQGGDMCRAVIHAVDPSVRIEKVRAVQSKGDRAEPQSVHYVRGRIHHVGYFGMLEAQMTTWVPAQSKSPDRIDALVHMLNELIPPVVIGPARATSLADREFKAR